VYLVNGAIAIASSAIGTYVGARLTMRYMEDKLFSYIQTEEFKSILYQVGGLVANGAKNGFGLNAKGKMKLEDIGMQLLAGFLQKYMPQTQPQETTGFGSPS